MSINYTGSSISKKMNAKKYKIQYKNSLFTVKYTVSIIFFSFSEAVSYRTPLFDQLLKSYASPPFSNYIIVLRGQK